MDDHRFSEADGMIEGRNAVIEALRAGVTIDKIYLQKGETDRTLGHIASKARSAGAVVVEADRRKLDAMSRTHAHQGVIALAPVREYATVEDIFQSAADKGEPPLLVVCDELSDPHNLGAVIRKAAQRRPHSGGGQDLRRGGSPCARCPGAQPAGPFEGTERPGRVGVWHGGRWDHLPL